MRIGIDAHGVGGASLGCGNETYFGNIIKNLIRLDAENEYHIFTDHPDYFGDSVVARSNVNYVALRPRSQWIQRPFSLPLYANKERLDLIHVPFIRPPFLKAKCILTVHDICFETHPEHFRKLEVYRMRALVAASCRKAQAIFTVSEFARQQLHQLYGIPLARIVVTPNAADHIAPFPLPLAKSELTNILEPYILYAGLLQPRKNLVRLVQAFEHLQERVSLPHHLVLCGKLGWGNDELKHHVGASTFKSKIHFTGYLPNSDFRALLSRASVFAFPSIFEGFGIPPMEAQRCQIPVVVSNSSCFPEIYADSAEYCDPLSISSIAHALERVLLDQNRRDSLIEKGARNWRRYSWSKTAAAVLKQYQAVHENGAPFAENETTTEPEVLSCV